MDIYNEIEEIKKGLKLNNNEMGLLINKTGDTFRKALNRGSLSDYEIEILLKTLLKLHSDEDALILDKIREALKFIRNEVLKNKQSIRENLLTDDQGIYLKAGIKNDPAYQDLFLEEQPDEHPETPAKHDINHIDFLSLSKRIDLVIKQNAEILDKLNRGVIVDFIESEKKRVEEKKGSTKNKD